MKVDSIVPFIPQILLFSMYPAAFYLTYIADKAK
jgi:hypothetical protein